MLGKGLGFLFEFGIICLGFKVAAEFGIICLGF